jgi:hypothetical protein
MPNLAWWYTPKSGGYFQIATVTAAGGETSLTFSSIPATYTDLQIRGVGRQGFNANQTLQLVLQFNNDTTAANYIAHDLQGDGSTVSAQSLSGQPGVYIPNILTGNTSLASVFGAAIIDFADYASTSKNKTVRSFAGADNNAATADHSLHLTSGLWMSTAAINSIKLVPITTFSAASTFTLYGIRAKA